MAMTREQDVFFIVGVAADWLLSLRTGEDDRRMPRTARLAGVVTAAAAFLLVYAPQLAAYKVLNGHFGPHLSVTNKMKWSAPHALQVLVSPEHGFFVWTPLAALAVLGLV